MLFIIDTVYKALCSCLERESLGSRSSRKTSKKKKKKAYRKGDKGVHFFKVVQFNDLTFLSRKGHPHMAKITISVYKHNSNNRPFDILLAAEESQPYCQVAALIQYCKVRGDRPGPLFFHADYSPISVYQFNSELQRCLTYCGLDISRYKSHSFRIG